MSLIISSTNCKTENHKRMYRKNLFYIISLEIKYSSRDTILFSKYSYSVNGTLKRVLQKQHEVSLFQNTSVNTHMQREGSVVGIRTRVFPFLW